MFVSVEVITMIVSAVTILLALAGGFGWMITRMDARFVAQDARFVAQDAKFTAQDGRFAELNAKIDARFSEQDAKIDARFAEQDAKWDARFAQQDTRFDRLETRIDDLTHEMTEVKIAIARLEGPTPRLITAR